MRMKMRKFKKQRVKHYIKAIKFPFNVTVDAYLKRLKFLSKQYGLKGLRLEWQEDGNHWLVQHRLETNSELKARQATWLEQKINKANQRKSLKEAKAREIKRQLADELNNVKNAVKIAKSLLKLNGYNISK